MVENDELDVMVEENEGILQSFIDMFCHGFLH